MLRNYLWAVGVGGSSDPDYAEHVAWPLANATCSFLFCRFSSVDVGTGAGEYPRYASGQGKHFRGSHQEPGVHCGEKRFSLASGGSGVDVAYNYTILQVQPPDERAGVVNSSIYTNAATAASLQFCGELARRLNKTVPYEWDVVGSSPYMPVSDSLWPGHRVHPEFEGYSG